MVTAYDFPSARHCESAGVDMLLVGDSLGMVVLGYDNTCPVTVDDMLHHCRAARRGAPRSFLLGDLLQLKIPLSPLRMGHVRPFPIRPRRVEPISNFGRTPHAGGVRPLACLPCQQASGCNKGLHQS